MISFGRKIDRLLRLLNDPSRITKEIKLIGKKKKRVHHLLLIDDACFLKVFSNEFKSLTKQQQHLQTLYAQIQRSIF